MRILYEQQMKGRTVIDSTGRAVGTVDALFLDTEDWSVGSIRVRLPNDIADELGVQRGTFHPGTIEVSRHQLQSVGDAVVLRIPVAGLRAMEPRPPESA